MTLLDTDVLIEYLRDRPDAVIWMESLKEEPVGIPRIVAMELVAGCRNQQEVIAIRSLIQNFTVIWPSEEMFVLAFDLLASLRLRTGIGLADCLVAAIALQRQAKLATFNIKHFRDVKDLHLVQPYLRESRA